MGDDDEARAKVRRLLLSGDNTLKNRDDPASAERARQRFEEALAVAGDAGLGEDVMLIIRRRLEPGGTDVV
jgi:hypothetical protein